MTPSRTKGLILLLTAVVAWSTAGLFTRLLALDAPTILFWRGLLGAVGTVAVMAATRDLASFRHLRLPGLAYAAVTTLSMLCFISSLLHTTVAHVGIITATVPFIAAFLGWAVLRERPAAAALVAGTCALTGVVIMTGTRADGHLTGDALALLMALGMGGMILISRRFPAIPALAATATASALSAVAVLPFADLSPITPQDLILLTLFALINQVLGFGLFALGARLMPPAETALVTALEAPLAPLWVWLVFAETPATATLTGGAIVLAAVLWHILRTQQTAPA
jgi:drug/metabolite transporter (DMT)-like permease